MSKIQFKATDLFLQSFRSNPDTFRFTAELGLQDFDNVRDLPKLPKDREYLITIEPVN